MSDTTLVTIMYSISAAAWLYCFGIKRIRRSWGYFSPVFLSIVSSSLLVLGTNYARGWQAAGYMVYGFLGMMIALVIYLLVLFFSKK